jgi:hypothetical protein
VSFTLACVWVRGHRNYGVEYVERLKNMVARHTSKQFNMVCLSDRIDAHLPCHTFEIQREDGFAWWEKRKLFKLDRVMSNGGRILYLDLDVIIMGDLDPIIDYPADFAISPCSAPNWQGKDGLVCVKGYNSSVMVWNDGARRQFHDAWTPDVAMRLWGDQDWYKEISPNEAVMPAEWFERLSGTEPKPETKVVFCIKTKNHKAIERLPWLRECWT